jgi:hypothetical protein
VADPSAEGDALARALCAGGFRARRVDPAALAPGGDTALVVLAGDGEGALSLLDRLRRDPRTALLPIILTGVPASGPADLETLRRLGADAVYPRPVPIDRIVRKAETFVSPAEQLRRSATDAPAASVPMPTPPPPPRPSAPPGATLALSDGVDSWHLSSAPAAAEPVAEGSGPSSGVLDLLREADRRLFPDAPEVDLSFADPGATVEALLRGPLLSPVPLPDEEPAGGDPLGAEGSASGAGGYEEATTVTARLGRLRPTAPARLPASGAAREGSGISAIASRPTPLLEGPLAADLPVLVVLGARQRFTREEAVARLGAESVVRLAPDASDRMARLEVDGRLLAWLERHDGDRLDHLLADVPPDAGGPGLVVALAALGVLAVHRGETQDLQAPPGRAALRGRIAAAHARALDGDYFAVLGVPRDAGLPEIEAAHQAAHRALMEGAPLDEALAHERRLALEALDEARRILSVERLRRAYRAALEGDGGAP